MQIYGLFGLASEFKRKDDPQPEKLITLCPSQALNLQEIKKLQNEFDVPVVLTFVNNGEIIYYSVTSKKELDD